VIIGSSAETFKKKTRPSGDYACSPLAKTARACEILNCRAQTARQTVELGAADQKSCGVSVEGRERAERERKMGEEAAKVAESEPQRQSEEQKIEDHQDQQQEKKMEDEKGIFPSCFACVGGLLFPFGFLFGFSCV
jgi:hypothetical protein